MRLRLKPPYEGSQAHVLAVIPVLVIRPADKPYRFIPPDGAAALDLIDTSVIEAGPVLRFRDSRSDSGRYGGLKRIPVATEPGVFLSVWPAKWLRARIEARRGVTGHSGWVSDLSLDYIHTADVARGERWDYSIGPRVGWGDNRYMMTYYGITPEEAQARHVLPYVPGSGLRYSGGAAAVAYHLDRRCTVKADVRYSRLGSKAQAGPVVQTVGSGGQLAAGFGFSYAFGFSL
jgi:outer membrane protein